ncbi:MULTISPECIES: right-handed parallel beta-helix repeat-containing protein [unclassified Geodermatophilus]
MERTTNTTGTRFRGRAVRTLAVAGAGAMVLGALPGVASAHGGGGRMWDVREGESIQAAVDQARSGDTIRIAPGTYTEAVCIDGKGLTIRGAGRDQTIIQAPDDSYDLEPGQACWEAQNEADGEDDDATLRDNLSGLFFLDPDSRVVVKDLQTQNHPANGISAWGADGFTVTGTKGLGHDRYGIFAGNSHNIHIVGNVEEGIDRAGPGEAPNSGTAGISIGDSADSRALVAGNRVRNYNLGVFLREASGGRVDGNHVSGNCIGILTFDDATTETPGAPDNVEAGDWKINGNVSQANNRWCLQGRAGDQRISGVGMAVVNAANVRLTANVIKDHNPTIPPAQFIPPPPAPGAPPPPPLTFPPGGLVLLSFAQPPGSDPNPDDDIPGLVTDVKVVANWFGDNRGFVPPTFQPGQMDIFVGQASPTNPFIVDPGPGLEFRANRCDASFPADICGG